MDQAEIEAYEARLIIADVLEALDQVQATPGDSGTHYETCYMAHAECLASRIRSLIEDGDQ